MFFFRITGYLNYLLFSRHRNGYGIHSPFIFDLISRVFRNKTGNDIVLKIENIRKRCSSSEKIIRIIDLGAGSLKMKGDSRKVSDIARYSAVPKKYGVLLSVLAAEFGKPAVIELGTSLGISTMYIASGCPGSVVYSVDACPETSSLAMENFGEAGFENIRLLNGSFDSAIQELKKQFVKPGLVFIDGDHRREPLLRYFNQIVEISDGSTVIVLDDIHQSREMEEAWNQVKQHKNVTATVDLYRIGLVFLRGGMSRSDYVIRY
ncbi:MAG TPA: class I SAM-dependent methyltransferase [Bacteroidales bacterium]|nr:class I SAM-dependent methyltransferase [Bacteroidales bacterium]